MFVPAVNFIQCRTCYIVSEVAHQKAYNISKSRDYGGYFTPDVGVTWILLRIDAK